MTDKARPPHPHSPDDDPECPCYIDGWEAGFKAGEAFERAEHEDDAGVDPRVPGEPLTN